MNTARRGGAGAGTQTAALGFAGYVSTGTQNTTEAYDGSTWTTLPATLATARGGLWGAGTNTLALAFGGGSYQTATEEYNDYSPTKHIREPRTSLVQWYYEGIKIYI
jgi:hypothetical protein